MPGKGMEAFKEEIVAEVMAEVKAFFDELSENMNELDLDLSQIQAKMKGKDGEIGAVGPIGPQGIQGIAGPPGRDGVNGRDGINGIDGIDGAPGKQGKDGIPGKDAIIDWDEINRRIKKLMPRQSLIRLGGGGGGMSLPETPSGTVNGVNTTFYVTSLPKFIIVDGVSKFQDVHYTLTGSTIEIIDNSPPVQFIRAIS